MSRRKKSVSRIRTGGRRKEIPSDDVKTSKSQKQIRTKTTKTEDQYFYNAEAAHKILKEMIQKGWHATYKEKNDKSYLEIEIPSGAKGEKAIICPSCDAYHDFTQLKRDLDIDDLAETLVCHICGHTAPVYDFKLGPASVELKSDKDGYPNYSEFYGYTPHEEWYEVYTVVEGAQRGKYRTRDYEKASEYYKKHKDMIGIRKMIGSISAGVIRMHDPYIEKNGKTYVLAYHGPHTKEDANALARSLTESGVPAITEAIDRGWLVYYEGDE